jgi:hypothetical protein
LLDAYRQAGKTIEATRLIQESLTSARRQFASGGIQLAGTLSQYGLVLLQLHAWSDAEPLLRECLAIREKQQPDAWTTFNTQSMLGAALFGQKKLAEAEPLLLQGYEGMKQREKTIPPQGATRIPEALDRFIDLYTALDKPIEVQKWRAERAKYPPPLAPAPRAKK